MGGNPLSSRLSRISFRRAEVLRELAARYTERQVAERLNLTLNTVRGHIER